MLIFVYVYNSLSNVGSRKTSRDVTTHVDACLTDEIYDHFKKMETLLYAGRKWVELGNGYMKCM